MQQIAQQNFSEISILKQAIVAVRGKTTFLDHLQNEAKKNYDFVQNATPEERSQAEEMLQNINEDYLALFNNIVIDFFR